MRAIWNKIVIAESDDIVTVEGNVYFPLAALKRAHVAESQTHTTCSWKGVASYFDLVVDGEINKDAAWFYPTPKAGAEKVAGRVAFWKGVQVE
jgi:uncharacterized protein (DUF427 family)